MSLPLPHPEIAIDPLRVFFERTAQLTAEQYAWVGALRLFDPEQHAAAEAALEAMVTLNIQTADRYTRALGSRGLIVCIALPELDGEYVPVSSYMFIGQGMRYGATLAPFGPGAVYKLDDVSTLSAIRAA